MDYFWTKATSIMVLSAIADTTLPPEVLDNSGNGIGVVGLLIAWNAIKKLNAGMKAFTDHLDAQGKKNERLVEHCKNTEEWHAKLLRCVRGETK
jgi:hypothetical protein